MFSYFSYISCVGSLQDPFRWKLSMPAFFFFLYRTTFFLSIRTARAAHMRKRMLGISQLCIGTSWNVQLHFSYTYFYTIYVYVSILYTCMCVICVYTVYMYVCICNIYPSTYYPHYLYSIDSTILYTYITRYIYL